MATTDDFADLPLLLTVGEAGHLLRQGRSTAYEHVNRYLDSGGLAGTPAIRVGSSIRVPRWALVEWITTGVLPRLGGAVEQRASKHRSF